MKLKWGMEFRGLFSFSKTRGISLSSADSRSQGCRRVSFTILRRESAVISVPPWLFLKTIPPTLASVQTSKVNNSHREKHGHSYLMHFIQNTVFFLLNAFECVPEWKLEKYTPYKYVCFHHWSLEYKLHLNKPQVSICLCKLRLDDLNCSSLQGYKTNIERTVFRLVCQDSVELL